MGGTFKISSSCVIPSLSADKEKVYVLTSRAFQMHSHTGAVLFSWTSPKLEYQGFMEPSPNFLDSPINQNGKFRQQWRGRFGGQIALDNSGVATEVYFTSPNGHIFRCTVGTNPQESHVTVLMLSFVHTFSGATIQTYRVPDVPQLQKRLYVTAVTSGGSGHPQNLRSEIYRININALLRWVEANGTVLLPDHHYPGPIPGIQAGDSPIPGFDPWSAGRPNYIVKGAAVTPQRGMFPWDGPVEALWNQFAKTLGSTEVSPKVAVYTRLAYAQGKLYYLNAKLHKRATLRSTDVTQFVDCDEALSLTNSSFHAWVIEPSDYEKSHKAPILHENLHETSKYAGTFPWEFTAYKKVVPWKTHLVVKEMICSRPKPPTTRPSQERCCVRKRVETNVLNAPLKTDSCKLEDLMRQL